MNIIEATPLAMHNLAVNKMRSLLTVLGVVIGITAVVTLVALGRGVQESVVSQIQGMGVNLIIVSPGATQQAGQVRAAAGSQATLTMTDVAALSDPNNAPLVAGVAPELRQFGQAVAGSNNISASIYGVTPDYETVRLLTLSEGDFITQQNIDARALVAVLGSNIAQTLFGDAAPLGQTFRIQGRSFTVVGLLKSTGGLGGTDDSIYVPLSTAQYRMASQRRPGGALSVQTIYIAAPSSDLIQPTVEQVASVLREQHRIGVGQDDFTIRTLDQMIGAVSQVLSVFTLFLGGIAGISLLVGGIGIMNIMLVSVTERTREIGLRKAVGAKRRDILQQFLIEAATLSFGGGAIGVLLSWLVTRLVGRMSFGGTTLTPSFSADIVILGLVTAVVIGLFFGVYPAMRAARLNPIEALRYE